MVVVFPVCTGLRLAEAILSLTTPKFRYITHLFNRFLFYSRQAVRAGPQPPSLRPAKAGRNRFGSVRFGSVRFGAFRKLFGSVRSWFLFPVCQGGTPPLHSILHSTLLYSTPLHSILHSTLLHSTLHSTLLYSTLLYSTRPCAEEGLLRPRPRAAAAPPGHELRPAPRAL